MNKYPEFSKAPPLGSCCKLPWKTYDDAMAMIAVEWKGNTQVRAYKCPVCNYWHTTSKEDNRAPANTDKNGDKE